MKNVRFLTVPEARTLLGVCDGTVYRMLADGRLTSYQKYGRHHCAAGVSSNPHAITLDSIIKLMSR
jgi:excisionase family DNA binding protein